MENKEKEYRELIADMIKNKIHFIEKIIIRDNIEFYNFIISKTSFLVNPKTFIERIYCIIHNLTSVPLCDECNENKVGFFQLLKGYNITCSLSCGAKHSAWKRAQTILENSNQKDECNICIKLTDNEYVTILSEMTKNKKPFYEKRIFNENIELYNFIMNKTSFLNNPIFPQRVYHILNNLSHVQICPVCKENEVKFIKFKRGYNKTCSPTCGSKNSRIKAKATCTMLYKVDSYTKTEECKAKVKATLLLRYGMLNYVNTELGKITKELLYGNPNYNNREKFFETMQKLYKFKHALQNSEIFSKSLKSRFDKHEYIFPSGKKEIIQGWENITIDNLLKKGIKENDIVISDTEIEKYIGTILYLTPDNKLHRYYPDAYIISENRIYETKSNFTYEKDQNKIQFSGEVLVLKDINFTLKIYIDKKGTEISEPDMIAFLSEKQKSRPLFEKTLKAPEIKLKDFLNQKRVILTEKSKKL